jgi:NAD(P)-dependent dehydrogenase (short-subunit alcohol dehydrogenase family)
MADKAIIVIGAGDALGGAIAKRFAREGYAAVIVRRHADQLEALAQAIRDAGGEAHAVGLDARKEEDMVALFDRVEAEIAPVEVCVFNIGANVRFPIAETTARVYFKVWEMAAFAGFLAGREAAKRMTPRGRGTILFTGATASLRGGVGFSAFSGAKHALRALAQSMARELGPQGIHVAHVIIDGGIGNNAGESQLAPDAIAESYWHLHRQPKSAWTLELDLRPWTERF